MKSAMMRLGLGAVTAVIGIVCIMYNEHYRGSGKKNYLQIIGGVFGALGLGIILFAFMGMGSAQKLEVQEVVAKDQSSGVVG